MPEIYVNLPSLHHSVGEFWQGALSKCHNVLFSQVGNFEVPQETQTPVDYVFSFLLII